MNESKKTLLYALLLTSFNLNYVQATTKGQEILSYLEPNWKLHLPISGTGTPGKMLILKPSQVSNYNLTGILDVTDDHALVMTVDVDDVIGRGPGKSANSKNYRTEFSSTESFSLKDPIYRVLELTLSVDKLVNAPDGVVIVQIHGPGPRPNMELKVTMNGSIIAENHKNRQGTNVSEDPRLVTDYVFGSRMTLKIVAGAGLIKFWYNEVFIEDATIQGSYKGQYFKFGSYCHSTLPGAFSQVSIYNVTYTVIQ